MKRSKAELADYVISRNSDLLSERAPFESVWEELRRYFLPRRAPLYNQGNSLPSMSDNDALFDSTGMQAASVLANGQLSYITPADSRWFSFEPPFQIGGSDKAKQWYQSCSSAAQFLLSTSNFYAEIHEAFYDDSVFGTYCMFIKPGKSHPLVFTKQDVGTYCIGEDDEGNVTTCYRKLMLTLDQAVERFGIENLSERLRKLYEDYQKNGKGGTARHAFIHAVYPRPEDEREQGKQDGENKPWASVYVEETGKHVARVSGYDEKPFFAGRHDKHDQGPYGVSPAWKALPDARQLNFLVKQLDALAEIKAFPRLLIPATHEGEIDLRSGGITYFDPSNAGALPKEWGTQGEYAIGVDREKRKEAAINSAMYVDLFRMFSTLDKQMTAREVAERSSEKLAQFSPSFSRKTTELLTPMLQAVFGILLQGGHFMPPPREALVQDPTGPAVAPPNVNYVSRVALALRAMQNASWQRTMESQSLLWKAKPEMLDNFDLDVIARDTARNDGLPAEWLRDVDEVDADRKARIAQQQQAFQAQQAQVMADAGAKLGSVQPDSMVGQMLQKQMASQGQ